MASKISKEQREILRQKSEEFLKSAELLAKQKNFNAAATSLYFCAYLKVYTALLATGSDSTENKKEKHKVAFDFLYKLSAKRNPDANCVHMALSAIMSPRAKACYAIGFVSEAEYKLAYENYRKNAAPFDRIMKIEEV